MNTSTCGMYVVEVIAGTRRARRIRMRRCGAVAVQPGRMVNDELGPIHVGARCAAHGGVLAVSA